MSLARAWTRQLYGASGAALLVPGTVIASLLLLAIAGGFGGFGALGQAFAGPTAPAQLAVAPAGAAPLVPVPAAGRGPTLFASTAAGVGPRTSGAPARTPTTPSQSNNGQNPNDNNNHPHTTTGNPGVPPKPAAGAGGSTIPGPAPSVWDNVVGVGTTVTRRLPGPVGTAATNVLNSVGGTLNNLLPVGPTSPPASSPSSGTQLQLPGLPPIHLPPVHLPALHLP